jgi:AAA domain
VRPEPAEDWTDGTTGDWHVPGNSSEPELPAIEDGAEILSKPIVLPPDIIEGLVHAGGKVEIGGASKSFKTWLLIDLAVSVATGAAWLNGYTTTKGRVLYVNFELPDPFCAKRLQTVCDERQLKLEPGMLSVLNLRGHVKDWPQLQQQFVPGQFVLIILDPSYKLLRGRDENKAGDIAALLDEFEVLAVQTGAAVAFGAHYSKGNQAQKESIDRVGGSGVFARDPDTILAFTKHEERDCFTVEMTLRNHPPQDPFVVKWEFPLFSVETLLDPTKLKQAGRPRDEETSAEKILELLDKPLATTTWQKLAYGELNVKRATFYRRLDELEADQKIVKGKERKWRKVS